MSIKKCLLWNHGNDELAVELFNDFKANGKQKCNYMIGQYFAIGKSFRGKIKDIDFDLTSEQKTCNVFVVLIIYYTNKKGVDASIRIRLNSIWAKELVLNEDKESLELYLELSDKK